MRMPSIFHLRILLSTVAMLILCRVDHISGQPQQPPAINWAEWNVSVGFITGTDIRENSLMNGIYSFYSPPTNNGITYSVAKPLGRYFTAGLEMSELRLEGYRDASVNVLGLWVSPESYITRIRYFNLALKFHPFSQWPVHPYLDIKPGISAVIARINYPDIHFADNTDNSSVAYLEKRSNPSLSEIYNIFGCGIRWNADRLLSFDIGFEISRVKSDNLKLLPGGWHEFDNREYDEFITYGRLILKVTTHSDITKLFKKKRNPLFKDKFKPHEYLPFYKKKRGK
jgi:hypothetical protein